MSEPPRAPVKVIVTDVDIRFTSMVWLMVKAAIAAIPAILILAVLGLVVFVVFAALGHPGGK